MAEWTPIGPDQQVKGLGRAVIERRDHRIQAGDHLRERAAKAHLHLPGQRVIQRLFKGGVHQAQVFPFGETVQQGCIHPGDGLAVCVHVEEGFKGNLLRRQPVYEAHSFRDLVAGAQEVNGVTVGAHLWCPFNHDRLGYHSNAASRPALGRQCRRQRLTHA